MGIARILVCRIWLSTYTIWCLTVASGYNLTFLTVERFLAITRPMTYRIEVVNKRLPFILLLAWLMGMILASVNLFLFYVSDGQCFLIVDTDTSIIKHVVPIYSFTTYCVIPAIVMTFANIKMGFTLR